MYEDQVNNLRKWASGFGHKDLEKKDIEIVSSLMDVNIENKTKKEEVWEMV